MLNLKSSTCWCLSVLFIQEAFDRLYMIRRWNLSSLMSSNPKPLLLLCVTIAVCILQVRTAHLNSVNISCCSVLAGHFFRPCFFGVFLFLIIDSWLLKLMSHYHFQKNDMVKLNVQHLLKCCTGHTVFWQSKSLTECKFVGNEQSSANSWNSTMK